MTYWIEYKGKDGYYKPLKHWKKRENEWTNPKMACSYYAWIINHCPNSPLNRRASRLNGDGGTELIIGYPQPEDDRFSDTYVDRCESCQTKIKVGSMVYVAKYQQYQPLCSECIVTNFHTGCIPRLI